MTAEKIFGLLLIGFSTGMVLGMWIGDYFRRTVMAEQLNQTDEHATYFMQDQELPCVLRRQAD